MNVAATVMVMPDGNRAIIVRIGVGIRSLIRSHMNVSRVVIVIRPAQRDSGPVGGVADRVLRLRQAMQVHGRQDGDAQTDAEMAKCVRQVWRLPCPV